MTYHGTLRTRGSLAAAWTRVTLTKKKGRGLNLGQRKMVHFELGYRIQIHGIYFFTGVPQSFNLSLR